MRALPGPSQTPAANVTLGEAPTWDELFENGFPTNRDALLLTDVLDYLEITQPNNITITFGDIRQCAIHGTTGDEQKDRQIKRLSTFVMLKPGYTNDHSYIPPNLRQTITAPIVLLDSMYKSCFIAIHYLRNSKRWDRLWQYGKDGKREWRVDGLTVIFAIEHHPFDRTARNVFFSEDEKLRSVAFEEYELRPMHECTTYMTQTHRYGQRWDNMSFEERARQEAVNHNIQEVTSGKHIQKLPDPGEGIIQTGGMQRMDIIDNQRIPNIQIRPDWLEKHVGQRRRIEQQDQDAEIYDVPGRRNTVRQAIEAVTRVENGGDSEAITRRENNENPEPDTEQNTI